MNFRLSDGKPSEETLRDAIMRKTKGEDLQWQSFRLGDSGPGSLDVTSWFDMVQDCDSHMGWSEIGEFAQGESR
eukprot:s468_g10.t1